MNGYIKYSDFLTQVEHQVDTAAGAFLLRKDQRTLVAMLYKNAAKHNNNGFEAIEDIPADLKFKTYNKVVFLAYMGKLDQVDNLLNDMLGDYKGLLGLETKLLNVLKEEYRLKDE